MLRVVQKPWLNGESPETISRMMIGHSLILGSQPSKPSRLLWDVFSRKHANVGTNSQDFFGRNGIAVEGAAVKKNKVTGLGVYLEAVSQRLLLFLFVLKLVPIFFDIAHSLISEVLLVNEVGARTHHKPSLIFAGVGKSEDTLVAPYTFVNGSLVAMEEGVDRPSLVIPCAVHEAETVEGGLQVLGVP